MILSLIIWRNVTQAPDPEIPVLKQQFLANDWGFKFWICCYVHDKVPSVRQKDAILSDFSPYIPFSDGDNFQSILVFVYIK